MSGLPFRSRYLPKQHTQPQGLIQTIEGYKRHPYGITEARLYGERERVVVGWKKEACVGVGGRRVTGVGSGGVQGEHVLLLDVGGVRMLRRRMLGVQVYGDR